jgi:hypothetical protein
VSIFRFKFRSRFLERFQLTINVKFDGVEQSSWLKKNKKKKKILKRENRMPFFFLSSNNS